MTRRVNQHRGMLKVELTLGHLIDADADVAAQIPAAEIRRRRRLHHRRRRRQQKIGGECARAHWACAHGGSDRGRYEEGSGLAHKYLPFTIEDRGADPWRCANVKED